MAETKLGSKRGVYAKVKATAGKENGVWEIRNNPKPKELGVIDKERGNYSKQINSIKLTLEYTTEWGKSTKEIKEQRENTTRWINKNIFGTNVKGNVNPLKDREINLGRMQREINNSNKASEGLAERIKTTEDTSERRRMQKRIKEISKSNKERTIILKRFLGKEQYEQLKKTGKVEGGSEVQIKIKDLLKEGRTAYGKRKPLDQESSKIRRTYNRAFKSISDAKRYANREVKVKIPQKEQARYFGRDIKEGEKSIKAKKSARVWINNKEVLTSQITLVYDTKTIIGKNGKPRKIKVNERYILPKGIISGWGLGKTAEFTISSQPTRQILKEKEKEIKGHAKGSIVFHQDSIGRLYTDTNMKTLFRIAEQRTGQRIIYINNQALTEQDVELIDGKWFLTQYAMANIQAGTSSLSYQYNPSYFLKTYEFKDIRENIQQKPIIAELDSIVVVGNKNQKVHIIIYTLDAFIKLKEARKLRSQGVPISWVATQFSLSENMNKSDRNRLNELRAMPEVALDEKSKAELKHLNELDQINIVAEVQGAKLMNDEELAQYQASRSEYLVLSFSFDKTKNDWIFGMVLKSSTLDIIAGEMEMHYEG